MTLISIDDWSLKEIIKSHAEVVCDEFGVADQGTNKVQDKLCETIAEVVVKRLLVGDCADVK